MCADDHKAVEAVNNDYLVQSDDPEHPANLIPELCRRFYNWGWVTGTGGGVGFSFSFLAPIAPTFPLYAESQIDFHSPWRPHLHRSLGCPEGADEVREHFRGPMAYQEVPR